MHMIRSNIFFYNFYKRYHTKVKKLKLYYAREVCKIIMITRQYIMTFKYDNITRERFSYYFLYEVRTLEFVYIFLILFLEKINFYISVMNSMMLKYSISEIIESRS